MTGTAAAAMLPVPIAADARVIDLSGRTLDGPLVFLDTRIGRIVLVGTTIPGGLELDRVEVEDGIDARGARLGHVRVARSKLAGAIRLDEADVAGDFKLEPGTEVKGPFTARHAVVRGLFDARGGIVFARPVTLSGARLQGEVVLEGARFLSGLDLSEAELGAGLELESSTVSGDLDLNRAEVAGWADLSDARVDGAIRLSGAAFASGIELRDARAARLELVGTTVGGDLFLRGLRVGVFGADLERLSVRGRADLTRAAIAGPAMLAGARFEGLVAAEGARFDERVELKGAGFDGPVSLERATFGAGLAGRGASFAAAASFARARFGGDVHLDEARFAREADFTAAQFEGEARFERARFAIVRFDEALFGRGASLFGVEVSDRIGLAKVRGGDVEVTIDQVRGRLAGEVERAPARAALEYHALRRWFDRGEEREAADEAYRRGRACERRARRGLALGALEWLLADLACAYGTRPGRVAATSVLVVLGLAVVYGLAAAPLGIAADLGAGGALALSLRAFASLDIAPAPAAPLGRHVLAAEAYLGFLLMALFVGTLTRKLAR